MLPDGINERLMKLLIPIGKSRHLTVTSAFAPTFTSSHNVKEEFYDNLDHVINITPQSDKLVLLGDFSAGVGRDYSSWAAVTWKAQNRQGQRQRPASPQQMCRTLCITNSLFRRQTSTRLLGCTQNQNIGT